VFKKLKARVTGGGTAVETTLRSPDTTPGGTIEGEIHVAGGEVEQEIKYLAVSISARVEVEGDDVEYDANIDVGTQRVSDDWQLAPGDERRFAFTLPVPIEMPFNVYRGRPLPGVRLGLRTELEIARSVDRGDLDPINVHPLPAQERVMDAFSALGFTLKHADLERGRLRGASLPFYQEVEWAPPRQYAAQFRELELTFVSRPDATDVILEVDKRGGLFTEGQDAYTRMTIAHSELERLDVEGLLQHHLQEIARKRGIFG
jgi:sporulation-control protein